MALPTTNNNLPQTEARHDHIKISLTQLFSLMSVLVTLKILGGVSIMTRGKKPTAQCIQRIEQRIVTLLGDIIPESFYRPRSHHSFPCDEPLGSNQGSGPGKGGGGDDAIINLRTATTESTSTNSNPLVRFKPSPVPSVPAPAPQCLSQSSGERARELARTATTTLGNENNNNNNNQPVPVDSSLVTAASCQGQPGYMTAEGRLDSLASSFVACRPPQNTPVSAAQHLVEDQPRASFSSCRMSIQEEDPDASEIFNATRVEEDMDGLRKMPSAESYPGRFPISDCLELCDLATAPFSIRGKGQISVRPLSDV